MTSGAVVLRPVQRLHAAGESRDTSLPLPFQFKIFAEFDDASQAQEMLGANGVTALELLLTRYRPLFESTLSTPAAPADVLGEEHP